MTCTSWKRLHEEGYLVDCMNTPPRTWSVSKTHIETQQTPKIYLIIRVSNCPVQIRSIVCERSFFARTSHCIVAEIVLFTQVEHDLLLVFLLEGLHCLDCPSSLDCRRDRCIDFVCCGKRLQRVRDCCDKRDQKKKQNESKFATCSH